MNIYIGKDIRERCPETVLGVLTYTMDVKESSEAFLKQFDEVIRMLAEKYTLPDIARMPRIQETREAYKALGKAPSHYRNASEAMLRRIIKGNGLYRINNAVEINNLVSICSGYSLGTYDRDKLFGDITLRRAPDGASYQGIGRDALNIEHLPVLYDEQGPFGNPTSDSERAKVTKDSRNLITVIYSFGGPQDLNDWMETYELWLKIFCDAKDIQTTVIR